MEYHDGARVQWEGSSHTRFPKAHGLYDPQFEKESCGVGAIANLDGIPTRRVITQADRMLVHMEHRGGASAEPTSGDGAGIMLGLPHDYYALVCSSELSLALPPPGKYASGIVFLPHDKHAQEECKRALASSLNSKGFKVLGWRAVPRDNSMIGPIAKGGEPYIEQIFVGAQQEFASQDDFEHTLYLARKLADGVISQREDLADYYVVSLSTRMITYKGQFTCEQVFQYYTDIQHEAFTSHVAIVHSRFSTNTFPSWARSQPNRVTAHNGEINTLRGNKNWMLTRQGTLQSEMYKDDVKRMRPIVSDDFSDSGNFDSVLELLCHGSPRSMSDAVMLMIPKAWQNNDAMPDDERAMCEFNSCSMEPWDGPAMMAFSDGKVLGAVLDRNGLRPCRYYVTNDDMVLLSSEVGVLHDLPQDVVKFKGRVSPGRMFLIDFDKHEITEDAEIKRQAAAKFPYRTWLNDNLLHLDALSKSVSVEPSVNFETCTQRMNIFGYTVEHMDYILAPMARDGKEGLGSMGNDSALACLSSKPRLVFEFFKQLFAQVTNPPIDPIREEVVMSLACPVGPEANLLSLEPQQGKRMVVEHPLLTYEHMHVIKHGKPHGWNCTVIDTSYPITAGPQGLVEAIDRICKEAASAVEKGSSMVVLSDLQVGPSRIAIPALCAVGAVHHHLIRSQLRSQVALFLESGEPRQVHDFCLLFGFGADGAMPYMAYEALLQRHHAGALPADLSPQEVVTRYRKAIGKGMFKVMAKMGISTLQSYKGAQIFEAVGLGAEVVDRCFVGCASRIKGGGFEMLYTDYSRMHEVAFPSVPIPRALNNAGDLHFRNGGEAHLNDPISMVNLQEAARKNSRHAYAMYSKQTNELHRKVTLRGQFRFKADPLAAIPVGEVEPVSEIVKRFVTGAMSLGSISAETHETLAIAMNRLGGKSNTGEGGEDPVRFKPLPNGDTKRSKIKQVASGRFGVTSNYLANSDEIQIKMAQGAKPGEGGELPGSKVFGSIAVIRHSTPGVGLISPPPHHDIYSIEDLAQLIHDLKNANVYGRVSVKLVSEVGVGVIAAGVAKAKADHITISGHDGGTGAAVWTGIKGCGLPWELGLAETQQTLVLNGLRDRVILNTDGQLKTGRDVVIAALLGAEEYGFSTAPLIALGCIMMRKCHLNTCPVGIATQDPELRKKFKGTPEDVMNFFFLLAEEVQVLMATLGFRRMSDMIGRSDLLEMSDAVKFMKTQGLDMSGILLPAHSLRPDTGVRQLTTQDHGIDLALDNHLIKEAMPALESQELVHIQSDIVNINRTVGTMLSAEVSRRYGGEGLPAGMINIKLRGSAGQSFSAFLAKGIFMDLEGDANDYVCKGLSGGTTVVRPPDSLLTKGFQSNKNMIIGNVACYGATKGQAYFSGLAGERFCVRNSGATAVVEGVGDHGCEYMTGGRAVILGDTGINFAAGMSGGIAYVYDPARAFPAKCNMGLVVLEQVEEEEEAMELRGYIESHQRHTSSAVASDLLARWEAVLPQFVKVMPVDLKRVLEEQKAERSKKVSAPAVQPAPAAAKEAAAVIDLEDMMESSGCAGDALRHGAPKMKKKVRPAPATATATAGSALPAFNKLRGFIEYERNVEPYRKAEVRLEDWGEINTEHGHDPVERKRQAARCMDCGTPFCQTHTGCPINNLIPEFNELVFKDQWKAALERLLQTNNFPEFTGRVCPAPCEGACVAGLVEESVTIKNIEYAIVDRGWKEGWIVPNPPKIRSAYRVAIVGSGPCGLAAADQLNKMGHNVTLYERADRIGGLLMYGIPNMKISKDTVQRRVDLMAAEGVVFKPNTEVGKSISTRDLRRDHDSLVLTTGATKPRGLDIAGHDLKGIHQAMEFLTKNTKALLETNDGKLKLWDGSYITAEDKHVVVIGGGDTGTDCIGTSLRHGANGPKSLVNFELLPQPPEERDVSNPWPEWPRIYRVDYGHSEGKQVFGKDPREYCLMTKCFMGDDNGNVCAVKTVEVEWTQEQAPDLGIKPKWKMKEVKGSEKVWPADLVILSLGFLGPEQTITKQLKLATDQRSNIEANYGDFQTSEPGVFAAGDCRRGQSLVVWAINEGRLAADCVHQYLSTTTAQGPEASKL
jgi:glutamate synthase (NADPH/NADH)